MNHQNLSRQNSTNLPTGTYIAGMWGSLLTAVILTVAVRNLWINTRTLHLTEENLENTRKNAGNTTEMINQLKSINDKLERMT